MARTHRHRAVSLAGLGLFWAALALVLNDPTTLPGPWLVLPDIWREFSAGRLLPDLLATLTRVALAFVIAMGLGGALGLAMGLLPRLDRWLDSWLIVFLNLPALVTIVLCYLWIGLTETAAVTAVVLNKIPAVTAMIREGARVLSPNLRDMAKVYRFSRLEVLRHVILPQLAPYIAAAARSGMALIWKIVLVVEFLGRSNGIGFKIHMFFQLFDVSMVLAYALSFVAVMLLIETILLQPAERRATRWRLA
jgi:NitT/TauT family transport system permease protein